MKSIINELLNINYTDVNQIPNYKQEAYTILNKLNKNELLEIAKIENIVLINKNSHIDFIKREIYYDLVQWRNDLQVLGLVAKQSYYQ